MASVVEIIIKTVDQGSKQAIGGVNDSLSKLVTQYVSVTAAAIAVGKAFEFSVEQAAEAQKVNAQLNAVLKSTGGAAGMSADQIDKMATSLSRTTAFEDEAIKSSSALLLTFTKIGKDVFPQAQQAILDMSAALGQDLKSSTIQLGKALNDPIKGVTALQRVGVSFTKSQRDMIESMVEAGDTIGAQKLILQEISTEFGGSATAAANTYTGQLQQLRNEFGNLGEAIGNDMLPDLIEMVKELKDATIWVTDNYEAIKKWGNIIMWIAQPLQKLGYLAGRFFHDQQDGAGATEDSANALGDLGNAAPGAADGLGEVADASKDAEEAAKALSAVYTGMLSSMFAINDQNQKYADTIADLETKSADLAAEKNQLTLKMWDEQKAGKLTNDEYLRYIQNLDEITKKQQENTDAVAKAGEEQKKAGEKRVYDLVQQRLAADGIIDSGEYEYLQNLAVAKGLVTRAAADQAIEESKAADSLVQNFSMTQPKMDAALATMQQIAAFDGKIVQFGVNFTQSGSISSGMSSLAGMGGTANPVGYNAPTQHASSYHPINWGALAGGGGLANAMPRDSGGSGMAGTPYLIGTGAQPELFTPSTNGTFTPANKMGNTYNITVINPKRETAENSIRQELKKISYGMAPA